MLGKILLPILIVAIAWAVLRWRLSLPPDARTATLGVRPPMLPPGLLRASAYGLLALMIVGSGLYLYQDWDHRHAVIEVQVVNPITGAIQRYQVRRGDIDGRSFRTLDGQTVRIAEMERLILIE